MLDWKKPVSQTIENRSNQIIKSKWPRTCAHDSMTSRAAAAAGGLFVMSLRGKGCLEMGVVYFFGPDLVHASWSISIPWVRWKQCEYFGGTCPMI